MHVTVAETVDRVDRECERTMTQQLTRDDDTDFELTIGELAQRMGVATSMLRFYEQEGLITDVPRNSSGSRRYGQKHVEQLRFVACMKAAGLQLRDIVSFVRLAEQGDDTLEDRLAIIEAQHAALVAQIEEMKRHLEVLEYKKWFYTEAVRVGSVDGPQSLLEKGVRAKPNSMTRL